MDWQVVGCGTAQFDGIIIPCVTLSPSRGNLLENGATAAGAKARCGCNQESLGAPKPPSARTGRTSALRLDESVFRRRFLAG